MIQAHRLECKRQPVLMATLMRSRYGFKSTVVTGGPMKLTLCYAPVACSLVPLINLNEAGASFEVRKINLRKGENMTPDYLAMNPLHKVPVLIVEGRALTENVAINTYIARTYPAAQLLPSNSMDELEAISMMGWFSGGLHPHLTRIFNPARFCGAPGSEEATRTLAKKALEENFAAADKRLSRRRTRISFGARAAPRSSISRWTAMQTSLRTTIACISAPA